MKGSDADLNLYNTRRSCNCLDYRISYDSLLVNKREIMWEEAAVVYIQLLSRHML